MCAFETMAGGIYRIVGRLNSEQFSDSNQNATSNLLSVTFYPKWLIDGCAALAVGKWIIVTQWRLIGQLGLRLPASKRGYYRQFDIAS